MLSLHLHWCHQQLEPLDRAVFEQRERNLHLCTEGRRNCHLPHNPSAQPSPWQNRSKTASQAVRHMALQKRVLKYDADGLVTIASSPPTSLRGRRLSVGASTKRSLPSAKVIEELAGPPPGPSSELLFAEPERRRSQQLRFARDDRRQPSGPESEK